MPPPHVTHLLARPLSFARALSASASASVCERGSKGRRGRGVGAGTSSWTRRLEEVRRRMARETPSALAKSMLLPLCWLHAFRSAPATFSWIATCRSRSDAATCDSSSSTCPLSPRLTPPLRTLPAPAPAAE
eukprot:1191963-Rhodomonas_salina.1